MLNVIPTFPGAIYSSWKVPIPLLMKNKTKSSVKGICRSELQAVLVTKR